MFHYYQLTGGEEAWKPVPATHIEHVRTEHRPVFSTVLQVNKLVDDLSYEDKLKLKYAGPLYFDFDGADIADVLPQVNLFMDKLLDMGLDYEMTSFFISGGKGFHIEIPMVCLMSKPPKDGIQGLPTVYREIALELCVDKLDMTVYSQGRGRMWREPNVLRPNGKYKVPVLAREIREMTPEIYLALCNAPRTLPARKAPQLCLDLAMLYERCQQKVTDKIKQRAKIKPDPNAKAKASAASIGLMMMGEGIKETAGFNDVALQLGIAANTAGMPMQEFLEACSGLITSENLTWNRYNTPGKRRDQLASMYHYTKDNICYTFSVGAVKSLLYHTAPDLDGIETTQAEIAEGIKEAQAEVKEGPVDEYSDVASGVAMTKFGTYVDTEHGKKRVCAVSFGNTTLLKSAETGHLASYETDVMVNGRPVGRQTLELEVFASNQLYNRFCQRHGHAFQGTDVHLRGLMMRFVEQAKKKGKVQYIAKREGLDVINIPGHEILEFREPFIIWADNTAVSIEPRLRNKGVELSFQGHPNPRGEFQTDLNDAPELTGWIAETGNRELLKSALINLMTCQKGEMLAKMIGWYSACFWRQLFHKVYGQFPILHVNGGQGAGKTSLNMAMLSMFYYNREPKMLTPASTPFAIMQHMAASASIPMVIDEYKPWELSIDKKNQFKLMIRDGYNCREVTKGGGTRENADYRSLHQTQLSAPLVFMSEAAEDEAAIMERVVLLTMVKPAASVVTKWNARFHAFRKNRKCLSSIGGFFASVIINHWSLERLRTEFDDLYGQAQRRYMVTEADLNGGISEEEMQVKQNVRERSLYNHTVALFGFQQFRSLVNQLLDNELDYKLEELEKGIYDRMSDLVEATTAEYIKVLQVVSTMSYSVEVDRPEAIRENHEFAYVNYGGQDCIEIAIRSVYLRYRMYCKACGLTPLFQGHEGFAYAVKDCVATVKHGTGDRLDVPGVTTLNLTELAKLGVEPFK